MNRSGARTPNRVRQRLLGLVASGMLLAGLTGCWDVSEMREESFFIGMGIDLLEDGQIEISMLRYIPRPAQSGQGGGTGGGSGEGDSQMLEVISGKGPSMSATIDNLRNSLERKLTMDKVAFVVWNERLAREGMKPYLEFLFRINQIDQTVQMYITEEDARSFLEQQSGKLADFVIRGYGNIPTFRVTRMWNFVSRMDSSLESGYIPLVKMKDKNFVIYGQALFHRDRMAMKISGIKEMHLLHLLMDWEEEQVVIFGDTPSDAMIIHDSRRNMDLSPGKITLQYHIRGWLSESRRKDPLQHKKAIEREMEERLEQDLRKLLNQTREKGVDVLRIGERFRRRNRNVADWKQNFPELDMELHVRVELLSDFGILK